MKLKFVFILLITFILFNIAKSQESESQELSKIPIPENIKQELVRRILIFEFKSSNRQKVIYLSEKGIKKQWLPNIKNIEFRLLSDEELEDKEKGVYFFTKPELANNTYTISFAFGNPECDYSGTSWSFRISNKKLRLWYVGGMGGGCSGGRSSNTPGALNTYPNELEGYKFFNKGKLKDLKLTVSTKEDVKKSFGSDCENGCDFDDMWKINFSYFGSMYKETTVDNKKIKLVPKEELIGKIYSIRLMPKQKISFNKVVFPSRFSNSETSPICHGFDSSGLLSSAVSISYESYEDRYGLKYLIFENVNYTVGKVEKDNRAKGDLISIEYAIPDKIEEMMFIEQK